MSSSITACPCLSPNLQNVLKRQDLIYLAAAAETLRQLALFVTCLTLSVCLHRWRLVEKLFPSSWWKETSNYLV